MPIVQISLIEGRPAELKEQLIAELTETVVRALGVPRESVRVIITEVTAAHWGVGGASKAAQA
jgi:4-oxalocrotonate tautomerase